MSHLERMQAAIAAYQASRQWEGGPEVILWQLLVDARLYADAHAIDFGACDREAYIGYLETKD